MPLYEFHCPVCGAKDEVFTRSVHAELPPRSCPKSPGEPGHEMRRIVSPFARHRTVADQLAEAEARFGSEVDAAMGAHPDVGRMARRYDALAKNLPRPGDL